MNFSICLKEIVALGKISKGIKYLTLDCLGIFFINCIKITVIFKKNSRIGVGKYFKGIKDCMSSKCPLIQELRLFPKNVSGFKVLDLALNFVWYLTTYYLCLIQSCVTWNNCVIATFRFAWHLLFLIFYLFFNKDVWLGHFLVFLIKSCV